MSTHRISVGLAAVVVLLAGAAGCNASSDGASDVRAAAPPAPDAAPLPEVRLAPAFPKLSFRRPVFVTHAGDGSDRLFVVEQHGRVRVFPNDETVETAGVFLDIQSKVRMRHNEEGLLALAFHPSYATNGVLYVYYTASDPRRGVLSRFRVDASNPDAADPASEEIILEVEQPYGNHNGATVAFGPDGYLYLSLGDGGWANDPHDHGQNLGTLLGTILRLDVDRAEDGRAYAIPADNPFVDRPGARGEIWAYGLRNVWRMSFDRATGDLWAGDVGQNRYEEVDLIVKGGNYGWRLREGMHPFAEGETTATLIDPVAEYPRGDGISITGGYVYRGTVYPALVGVYFFGDYATGRLWGLRYENGAVTAVGEVGLRELGEHVTSFGETESGELLACTFRMADAPRSSGKLFWIKPR